MAAPSSHSMYRMMHRAHRRCCWVYRFKSTSARKNGMNKAHSAESTYDAIASSYQDVAARSILVSYTGTVGEPYNTCIKHGSVQAIYPFNSGPKNYALIQMAHRSAVDSILSNSQQFDNEDKIPIKSRFLYQPAKREKQLRKISYPHNIVQNTKIEADDKFLNTSLLRSKSANRQMQTICELKSMSEFAMRIRFFLCSALSEVLQGTLPGCSIAPFGSTVNGFGRNNGDLDMLLETDNLNGPEENLRHDGFLFLTKKKQENSRFQVQMTLETIGGIISHFIPQFSFVRRILKARVPIVRFTNMSTNIECDLSINNRSALYMSELLHLYSRLDHRVRPLVFTIRHWARINDITQSKPGLYISNFMLTWMVLFFLQVTEHPVVPFISQLRDYAGAGDEKYIDGVNIGFVRNWSKVPPSTNTKYQEELLLDFFRFYSTFDFEQNAISLHGGLYTKPADGTEKGVLYIENPIERELNACKIVSEAELRKFQAACATALRKLDSSLHMKPGRTPWGIMSIFIDNENEDKRFNLAIRDIFSEAESSLDANDQTSDKWSDVSSPISGTFSDESIDKNEEICKEQDLKGNSEKEDDLKI